MTGKSMEYAIEAARFWHSPGDSRIVDAEIAYMEKFDEPVPTELLPSDEGEQAGILEQAVSDEVRITEDSLRDHWGWDIPKNADL